MLKTRECEVLWKREVPEDPDSVTLTIRGADGSIVTHAYPGDLEHVSVGRYRVLYTPATEGTVMLDWRATFNGPPVVRGREVDWFYAQG
jgi:hypothetical protein